MTSLSNRPLWALTALFVLSLVTAPLGAASRQPLPLPFKDAFTSTNLDPVWTVHAVKANTIAVKDSALQICAHANTRAHIERTLGVDSFRASCALQSTNPAATPSLIIYWDAANYCQFGLNPRGTSRFTAREVLGGYAHDYDLSPTVPAGSAGILAGEWHLIAIEVSKDSIRYLSGDDSLAILRVNRRPERFAGTPTLLMIGQDPEAKLFPPPNPWIEPLKTNDIATCQVCNVRVEPLNWKSPPEDDLSIANNERDVFGEKELAAREDPSFESVSRYYPALKWSREIVGVKDHPDDVGVAADGSLQFTNDIAHYKKATASFEIGGYRFGSGATYCAKRLMNGYMPIVIADDEHAGLKFEQTVFGYTENFSPDLPLQAYVRFQVTNLGDAARNVTLQLNLQPASQKSPSTNWQLSVPEHGSQTVELRLPYAIQDLPAVQVTAQEFDTRLAEAVTHWEKLIAKGSRFEVPEERVQNAYRAWLAYNFLNVAKRGDVYHVCDGSGFYTQIYGYSAALYCNAMDLLGYHDLSAQYLDSLLTFVQTNGLLAVNFGDTDTGVALWAMSEHYRITRDADWLRRVAPVMLKMCNWIITQRRATLAKTNEPAISKGLIRYRPYADLLHPAADYFSNGYLCKGLGAAARVLAEIGMNEEAARLQKESDAYLKDIKASMNGAVFTDHGMKILPAIPDTHELWKEANGSANGYYGIIAPCMLEAGIPAWNDPKANLIVDALQRRGGLTVGICQFHNLVDHAYTYGYWMNCLQRNEPKRVVLGLYASMAYGMSRNTCAAVECTAVRSGENYWTLPHTYSNTQQLRLLRNMLLWEDGDTLALAKATPRPWLLPGKQIAVNEAPTLFGPVSYRIKANADGSMAVHLDPPTRRAPAEISIRLRHPGGLKIARVKANGISGVKFAGDTIRLRHTTKPLDLEVVFK